MKFTLAIEGNNPSELLEALKVLSNPSTGIKPAKKETGGENTHEEPAQQEETLQEETKAGKITIEMIRETMQKKSANGKKDEVKALLAKYKAANLTALDKALYTDFYNEVNAL